MSTCSDSGSQASPLLHLAFQSAPLRINGSRESHAVKLQEVLYQQMIENSSFCDVTLLIGEISLRAHWCVLVTCPFFRSLYDSGMKESVSGKIKLDFGSPYAMREAVKFLYLGQVQVTYERVRELLEVAEYLQITDMKKCCSDFLFTQDLTKENCIQILLLSSLYNLEIYHAAFRFLCGNLPDLIQLKEMLDFTRDSVQMLISDPTLSYVKQEIFFDFIVRWAEHDLPGRTESFQELFLTLNLKALSHQFLTETVEKHSLVLTSEKCKMHVLEAKIQSMAGLAPGSSDMREVIVLCGGLGTTSFFDRFLNLFPGNGSTHLYAFLVQEARWTELPPLPFPIRRPTVAIDSQGAVLVVDTDNIVQESQSHMLVLQTQHNTWTNKQLKWPAGEEDVRFHHVFCCGGRTFIVASSIKRTRPHHPSSMDKQDQRSIWQVQLLEVDRISGELSVKCFLFFRSANTRIQACCRQGDGTTANPSIIFVLGQKTGVASRCRNKKATKLITYDVSHDVSRDKKKEHWRSPFEPLTYVVSEGLLTTRLGKVTSHLFSLKDRRWSATQRHAPTLPPVDPAREDFATAAVNDEIYLFGGKGLDVKKPLASVAKFSLATRTWTELNPIPVPLMGAGVTVGRLPADVLRCHIDCPHCYFHSQRSRTVYDLTLPDHLQGDEEDDYDDYDDDDDYYDRSFSDEWYYSDADFEEDWY